MKSFNFKSLPMLIPYADPQMALINDSYNNCLYHRFHVFFLFCFSVPIFFYNFFPFDVFGMLNFSSLAENLGLPWPYDGLVIRAFTSVTFTTH